MKGNRNKKVGNEPDPTIEVPDPYPEI